MSHPINPSDEQLKLEAEMKAKAQVTDTVPFAGKPEFPDPILQFFSFAHLPPDLQAVSGRFYDMVQTIVAICPRNPERTVALRKLLEAKDAAVRAKLFK